MTNEELSLKTKQSLAAALKNTMKSKKLSGCFLYRSFRRTSN